MIDEPGYGLLGHIDVDHVERDSFRNNRPDDSAANGRLHSTRLHHGFTAFITEHGLIQPDRHLRLDIDHAIVQRPLNFVDVRENHPGALGIHALTAHVVEPQNDVLRRVDDRLPVGRGKNVVGRHHQGPRFQLRLE